mgnify:CR=1 FL=1
MKNIFYWSPFISKVATIQAVINSSHSINEYSNKSFYKASIVDAVHEWTEYEEILKEKKIELIYLNKTSNLKSIKKNYFKEESKKLHKLSTFLKNKKNLNLIKI